MPKAPDLLFDGGGGVPRIHEERWPRARRTRRSAR
jgi:hypothetical protein